MSEKSYKPANIAPTCYQLGTPSFPAYLSVGDEAMLIEGGTGAIFNIIVEQLGELGIEPQRVRYLALTHTHADHIGAVPHLKKLWPHLKVVASPVAARLLQKDEIIKAFVAADRSIARTMLSKGEVEGLPPELEDYAFEVDLTVKEGDRIDLGSGVEWTVFDVPGHSPDHIALYDEREGTLVIGDATGFYVPEKDTFWPNYFVSLESYCNSIRKLSALPARRCALGHNGVIEGGLAQYFKNAIRATESYHLNMLERLGKGEDPDNIALETAKWVNTLTDIQPFEVMRGLTRLLLKRSQSEADGENLFITP